MNLLEDIQKKTDIIGVVKLVDIIGESMDKLVDNKMINKIEKLLSGSKNNNVAVRSE